MWGRWRLVQSWISSSLSCWSLKPQKMFPPLKPKESIAKASLFRKIYSVSRWELGFYRSNVSPLSLHPSKFNLPAFLRGSYPFLRWSYSFSLELNVLPQLVFHKGPPIHFFVETTMAFAAWSVWRLKTKAHVVAYTSRRFAVWNITELHTVWLLLIPENISFHNVLSKIVELMEKDSEILNPLSSKLAKLLNLLPEESSFQLKMR